jgi:hypothetical protein
LPAPIGKYSQNDSFQCVCTPLVLFSLANKPVTNWHWQKPILIARTGYKRRGVRGLTRDFTMEAGEITLFNLKFPRDIAVSWLICPFKRLFKKSLKKYTNT